MSQRFQERCGLKFSLRSRSLETGARRHVSPGKKGVRTEKTGTSRHERGMSLLEVSITIAILGALVLLAAPVAGKLIRRSQTVGAYASIRQVLASARLQAVKRGVNVVVLADLTPENKIHLHTFQDRANTEAALTGAQASAVSNFEQDVFGAGDPTNEPTLGDVVLPSSVVVWKQSGAPHDAVAGIAFDEYTPPGSVSSDPSLTDRIAFLPTGGIVPPEGAGSGLPTPTDGRGIYFADSSGKNYFRVTVDSDISGRLVVDKYQAGTGYQASGWTWY
jgi:prepilin-type N-terminal cleavage/methylation domain-containing protein